MNEERTMVLEMLSAGKISIEQANQLIDALGTKPLSTEEEWPVRGRHFETVKPVQEYRAHQEVPGLTHFTPDQLIELSEHEVDPAYLKGMREVGLTDLTVDQIIELSEHDVKPSYITRLYEAGLSDITVDQIIVLCDNGIKPAYIKALREAGLPNLTVEEVIELSERGVEPSNLKALREVSS